MFTDHGDMVYTPFVGMIPVISATVLDCFYVSPYGENLNILGTDDPRTLCGRPRTEQQPVDVAFVDCAKRANLWQAISGTSGPGMTGAGAVGGK